MTHVVTENCDACRYTQCVTVCPVACFRGNEARLYIDPDGCVDCGACVPACPVHAIVDSFDLSPEQAHWLEANQAQAKLLPTVRDRMAALPGADARRAALGY